MNIIFKKFTNSKSFYNLSNKNNLNFDTKYHKFILKKHFYNF